MPKSVAAELVMRAQKLERACDPKQQAHHFRAVGVAMKPVAAATARTTKLGGDAAFTLGGFGPTGGLSVDSKVQDDGMGVMVFRTRGTAGQWRVAESGRNQGNASGFSGPGISQKTGLTSRTKKGALRKVRTRKGYEEGKVGRRWNGTTEGFGAWSAAAAAMSPPGSKLFIKLQRKGMRDAFLLNR